MTAAKLDGNEGAAIGFDTKINHETGPGALWIDDDEIGEPDRVTRFGAQVR